MEEMITKEDLRQFGLYLENNIQNILLKNIPKPKEEFQTEWLKSRSVRKIMDMSAASVQNLRVTGKVRYKKILGSYYYNKTDLENLFDDV